MKMLEGPFDNSTFDDTPSVSEPEPVPEQTSDQYLISSFRPERQSWSSHEPASNYIASKISNKISQAEIQESFKLAF